MTDSDSLVIISTRIKKNQNGKHVSEDIDNKYIGVGVGLALVAGTGTAIGAVTQNIGLWLAIGTGMGVAMGVALIASESGNDDDS